MSLITQSLQESSVRARADERAFLQIVPRTLLQFFRQRALRKRKPWLPGGSLLVNAGHYCYEIASLIRKPRLVPFWTCSRLATRLCGQSFSPSTVL